MKASIQPFIRNTLLAALLATQLTGCAALLVAGAVGGATVAMDRRDVGANKDDKQIEFRVAQIIRGNLSNAHINSEVFNRNVLLTGEVPSIEVGQQAERLARIIPNVRNVMNELHVGEPSSIATRASDTFITTKVKAQLAEDKFVQSSAFIVTTERGNVYLQGRVTQAEAGRASEIVSKISGVRRVVRLFDYLTDEQFKQLNR